MEINTDGFFDLDLPVQKLPEKLEELFNLGGWGTLAKYRSVAPLVVEGVEDTYRKTFAETYLFESKGSDDQHRYVGITVGYGGKIRGFGEEPIITKDTFLGELQDVTPKGNKERTVFKFMVGPVATSTVIIYKEDGSILSQDISPYIINGEEATVEFTETQGKIRATYGLTDNAPDLTKRLWVFTFEGFVPTSYVLRSTHGEDARMEDLKKGVFKFPNMRENMRIKKDTCKFYDTLTGSIPISAADYTLDVDANTITFKDGIEPTTVFAEYEVEYKKDANNSLGDIMVPPFNPDKPKELMGAAYRAIRYIYPSIPTGLSFIPQQELGLGWGRDSQVYFWGNITKDRIVGYFRLDPAPDPESTYFTPLYVGRLATIGKAPRGNTIIIGGCREEDEIKYEEGIKIGNNLVDYGVNTSNGNNSVLLQRAIGGGMYQKHVLEFTTFDPNIDTSHESRYNPSVYTSKYHIPPMFITHPSDGQVGRLDDTYAVHPKNIAQLDELEVKETSKNESMGKGDGDKKTFHFYHLPIIDDTFEIKLVSDDGCTFLKKAAYVSKAEDLEEGKFTVDRVNKKLILFGAVDAGVEVIGTYNFAQVYRYTVADTPRTPFLLSNITPYPSIGLGFLKKNL